MQPGQARLESGSSGMLPFQLKCMLPKHVFTYHPGSGNVGVWNHPQIIMCCPAASVPEEHRERLCKCNRSVQSLAIRHVQPETSPELEEADLQIEVPADVSEQHFVASQC